MQKILKILMGIGLILLLIGSVTAAEFDVDTLQVPFGYSDLKDGTSMLNDGHTQLYVGKMDNNPDVFESNVEEQYIVTDIGNDTYMFIDDLLEMYGFQEKVNIDGVDYLVSISKDSPLSNADRTLLKEDLDKFNEKNNLEPIAV